MVDHLGNFSKGDFPKQIFISSGQGCVKPLQLAYFILGSLVNHRWPAKLCVKTYTNIPIFTISVAGQILNRFLYSACKKLLRYPIFKVCKHLSASGLQELINLCCIPTATFCLIVIFYHIKMDRFVPILAFVLLGVYPLRGLTQTVCDASGRTVCRFDGDRISDGSGRALGRLDGDKVCDASGRTLGRLDGDRVTDESGRTLGYVQSDRLPDASGRTVARLEGDRLTDATGRTIARPQGLRRRQVIAYYYFFW
jgi:hypothetical protein